MPEKFTPAGLAKNTAWGAKRPLSYFYLLAAGAILLATFGCRSASPPDQPPFTPTQPASRATPTLPLPAAQPASTAAASDQAVMKNYTHPTARFSINHLEKWQLFERPQGVVFIDPGHQAGYSVFFSDVGQVYSEQELKQYLITFVAQNFAHKDADFSVISPEQRAKDFIVAQFTGRDPNLGPAINEIRVSQKGTIVFTLLLSATQEQWDRRHGNLQDLAGTFVALDAAPSTPGPRATESLDEEPVWEIIGPKNNEFGFLRPSNWEIIQKDENRVAATPLDRDIKFEAGVSDWKGLETDYEAAEAAALNYLSEIRTLHEDVQHLPPAEFPLAAGPGATIDFLYTKEGVRMAGSVITVVEAGKLYRIVFTAPAQLYEGALQWFNPMVQSFTILEPDEFIIEN